jgi:Protein of unknown function (DUF2795)
VAERRSTQHSPRIDDALEKETGSITRGSPSEARSEEWHQMEPAADDEPVPDARIAGDPFPEDDTLDLDEIEDRSLLAISLRPSAFPGTRSALLEIAEQQYAEPRVMSWLQRLDPDVTFQNVEDVWEALGGRHEEREHRRIETRPIETRPIETGAAPPQQPSSPSLAAQAAGLGKAAIETGVGFVVAGVTNVAQRVRRLVS